MSLPALLEDAARATHDAVRHGEVGRHCGSTVKRPKRWPWPRHGATGRCAMPLVIGAAALVAIAIALFRL